MTCPAAEGAPHPQSPHLTLLRSVRWFSSAGRVIRDIAMTGGRMATVDKPDRYHPCSGTLMMFFVASCIPGHKCNHEPTCNRACIKTGTVKHCKTMSGPRRRRPRTSFRIPSLISCSPFFPRKKGRAIHSKLCSWYVVLVYCARASTFSCHLISTYRGVIREISRSVGRKQTDADGSFPL